MFTLYAYPFRSRSERVLWTLCELGLAYEVIRLDPFKGELNSPEFIKLNPDKKMPVLVHGEKVLTESVAIMEYLNTLSDSINLIPTGTEDTYDFRKKLHYGLTEIEPYMWVSEQASSRLKGLYHWPEGTEEYSMSLVKKHLHLAWSWIESSEYMTANQFSLADIYFYHLFTWALQKKIETPGFVLSYIDKLEQRPAFPDEAKPDFQTNY